MLNKKVLCCVFALSVFSPVILSANDVQPSKMQAGVSDIKITTEIKALYAKSPLIKAANISVTTNNHIVMLTGTLETDLQYEKAIELAQSIDEVTDVDVSHLNVIKSKTPLADTYITAKVKGTIIKEKLYGDKSVEYWPISIETKNGVVYLTGVVDTGEQQENIIDLVKKIHGVISVKSSITVK